MNIRVGAMRVVAEVTINNQQAELLEHLCCYDLHEWFVVHCSGKYAKDELWKELEPIRNQCHRLLQAHEDALTAIQGANK